MKFIFCSVLGLIMHVAVFAQTKQDLMGDWKVVDVVLAPNAETAEKQMLEQLKGVFLKSTFHFKANNVFVLKSPDKELAIANANWNFDERKKEIAVTQAKAKGTPGLLMEMAVKVKDGKYYFLMAETPLVLVVEKTTSL